MTKGRTCAWTAALLFGLLPATIGWVGCGDDDTDDNEDCAWIARHELLPDDVIVRWTQDPTPGLPDHPANTPPRIERDWGYSPVRGVVALPNLEHLGPKASPKQAAQPGKAGRPGGGDWVCISM